MMEKVPDVYATATEACLFSNICCRLKLKFEEMKPAKSVLTTYTP